MKGNRKGPNKMWYLQMGNEDVQQQNNLHAQQANSACELRKQKNIVNFLSQAMCNLVPATQIEAINAGFFATQPGITSEIVCKHYAKTIESAKGHMKADRKNARSTKHTMHHEMMMKLQQDKTNKQV